MSYIPPKPNTLGLIQLKDINLREIAVFIDWTFFFMAWRLSGKLVELNQLVVANRVKWAGCNSF